MGWLSFVAFRVLDVACPGLGVGAEIAYTVAEAAEVLNSAIAAGEISVEQGAEAMVAVKQAARDSERLSVRGSSKQVRITR
jgi:hypothetical protein